MLSAKASTIFLAIVLIASFSSAAVIGTSSIQAPAVLSPENIGSLTQITLTVTNGTGEVVIRGPEIVGNSTSQSALSAAVYASQYLGLQFKRYNFTYDIANNHTNVSGPSAGAAMTILAISALSHQPLKKGFTMTGTISGNGSIGPIGGLFDKAGAAASGGLGFILAPAVPRASIEDEIYLIAQDFYSIPVVPVANITQAVGFAMQNKSIAGNQTVFNLYSKYNITELKQANITCSNSCNYTPFISLLNSTFNITSAQVDSIAGISRFDAAHGQMMSALQQAVGTANKGYLYAAADMAFLDYVNAYVFANVQTNQTQMQTILNGTNKTCSAAPPQLTSFNYEYAISGELRQTWAKTLLNSTISEFESAGNETTTDDILLAAHDAAQANGWCAAADSLYAAQYPKGAAVSVVGIKSSASSAIQRASVFGSSLYLDSAISAYGSHNYAVALISADYQNALGNADNEFNLTTQQLDNRTISMLREPFFGAWPSQFANEAQFYLQQSDIAANNSSRHDYAFQAYSSAALATALSNDTRLIYNSLSSTGPTTTVPTEVQSQRQANVSLNNLYIFIGAILIVLVAILLIVFLIVAALHKSRQRKAQRTRGIRRKR